MDILEGDGSGDGDGDGSGDGSGFGPATVEVRCAHDPDSRITLSRRYFPDEHGVGFAVEGVADGLRARLDGVEVWTWDHEQFPDFLAGLASDFRGWDGERSWRTNHLAVRAIFRSGGHVGLTWALRPWLTRSDSWKAEITTWVEAGEQMATVAADVREFLRFQRFPDASST